MREKWQRNKDRCLWAHDEPFCPGKNVEAIKTTLIDFADKIWNLAELSLEEEQSSALLIDKLKEHGFTIDTVGTSNIPTAFTASYGSGSPVIGIMTECDALPGLGNEPVPEVVCIGSITLHHNHPAEVPGHDVERLYDKEIADRLAISPTTVKTHLNHIYAKLGVTSRREAAREAKRLGLV